MRVSCKSCGAAIPAANLNLDRMVAKCGACHAVFAFAVDGAAPPTRPRKGHRSKKLPTVPWEPRLGRRPQRHPRCLRKPAEGNGLPPRLKKPPTVAHPPSFEGRPLDGMSLLPILRGAWHNDNVLVLFAHRLS